VRATELKGALGEFTPDWLMPFGETKRLRRRRAISRWAISKVVAKEHAKGIRIHSPGQRIHWTVHWEHLE
jgi:hypothetical protein